VAGPRAQRQALASEGALDGRPVEALRRDRGGERLAQTALDADAGKLGWVGDAAHQLEEGRRRHARQSEALLDLPHACRHVVRPAGDDPVDARRLEPVVMIACSLP
jgi:hypothetical protein